MNVQFYKIWKQSLTSFGFITQAKEPVQNNKIVLIKIYAILI